MLETEAAGLGCGLRWLATQPPAGVCLVLGDSPSLIALGAGTAHVRDPAIHRMVMGALGPALAAGWEFRWARLPRTLNAGAHRQANGARIAPPWRGRALVGQRKTGTAAQCRARHPP